MTKNSLARTASLLVFLFVGGMHHAAAEGARYEFAGKQASIAVTPSVSLQASSGLPPDTELLNAIRNGRRILGIYAGNNPDNRGLDTESSKETIGGYPALTYRLSNEHGKSRQTFVQYKDDGFPNVIHFFYGGLTDEEAGIADEMIESLQLNGAPAAQK